MLRLTQEEVVILIASEIHGPAIPAAPDQTGPIFQIGPILFPPDVYNPNRSEVAGAQWLHALKGPLCNRGYMEHVRTGNIYRLSAEGHEVGNRLMASDKRTSDGAMLWTEVKICLHFLGEAQAAKKHDEVERLTARLLELADGYRDV
jgi:hypothetical protein